MQKNSTGRAVWLTAICLLIASVAPAAADEPPVPQVQGGLVVHLGCGDGVRTARLRASDACVVEGLDAEQANVEAARRYLQSKGLYGPVSVDRLDGGRLPYVDNLVNVLVADDLGPVTIDEVMRVLAPGGTAYVRGVAGWETHTKPWPPGIDEWTHYLHDPGNNAVAHDTAIGPPRHMQWLGGPEWTRNHHALNSVSSVVTSGGRLFFLVDEASPANINLPGKWTLVARDAFSGVTLWQKPLESWAFHRIGFRSGPPQLTRLLVAAGDRLYSPLTLDGPICQIDAATGETLKTFEATAAAEELIVADGVLYVLKGSPVAEQAFRSPVFKTEYRFPNQKQIVAVDSATGNTLWQWSDPEMAPMPETLAADARRVYIQVNEGVACLDKASGKLLWTFGDPTGKVKRKKVTYGVDTLVVADDVVLSNLSGRLTAISADSGKKLWDCEAGGGFHSPLDVFVIDGLVWQGLHTSDSVAPPPVDDFTEGRDLHTGQIKATNHVAVDLQTAGHHHRCYREKATDRFILTGKRGIELIDLEGNEQSRNNWIRGTCQYGIMPANGLLYAPPHSCGCYMESKLRGFWALAADTPQAAAIRRPVADETRLETGPAPKNLPSPARGRGAGGEGASPQAPPSATPHNPQLSTLNPQPSPTDWPTYGHDPLRSGVATTELPAQLAEAWKTTIGGRLTQPVAAEGKVVVSRIDQNTVLALDQQTGEVLWRRVVGGRVDSPPTIYTFVVPPSGGKGSGVHSTPSGSVVPPEGGTTNTVCLFGSADGWVYCLRLGDGSLVWRFLAAPTELNTVAFDRVESLWPVHGSVLVQGGVAYVSAGRSTWIDGGIDLWGLDPATGRVLCRNRYESRQPKYQAHKPADGEEYLSRVDQNTTDYKTFLQPDLSDSFSMAGGTVSDVLVGDGTNVFLHQVKFTPRLERRDDFARHLFSTSSLLDDAENHRSHWVLGSGDFSRVGVAYSWVVNRPGARMPTIAVPTGVMMVFDESGLWGVRRQGNSDGRYSMFKMANRPFTPGESAPPDFRMIPKDQIQPSVWQHDLPVRTRAMLKAGDKLFLGVEPVEIPVDDPYAAYEGRLGGSLWVCSERDGAKLAELPLDSPAVWGGMSAADGRLYVATADGSLHCFTGNPSREKKSDE